MSPILASIQLQCLCVEGGGGVGPIPPSNTLTPALCPTIQLKSNTDARKMLPESGFLFMEPKNELQEHKGSKVFITGKQTAPSSDMGRGKESPPLYCSIKALSFKDGSTNMESRYKSFYPLASPSLSLSVLVLVP